MSIVEEPGNNRTRLYQLKATITFPVADDRKCSVPRREYFGLKFKSKIVFDLIPLHLIAGNLASSLYMGSYTIFPVRIFYIITIIIRI